MDNLHEIDNDKVELVNRTDSSAVIRFFIPAESDFFRGHFPTFKLLPAVAQFWCVNHFAQKYLNLSRDVSAIKRVKFVSPVMPNTHVTLKLNYNKEKSLMSYELSDTDIAGKTYSLGTFSAPSVTEAGNV